MQFLAGDTATVIISHHVVYIVIGRIVTFFDPAVSLPPSSRTMKGLLGSPSLFFRLSYQGIPPIRE